MPLASLPLLHQHPWREGGRSQQAAIQPLVSGSHGVVIVSRCKQVLTCFGKRLVLGHLLVIAPERAVDWKCFSTSAKKLHFAGWPVQNMTTTGMPPVEGCPRMYTVATTTCQRVSDFFSLSSFTPSHRPVPGIEPGHRPGQRCHCWLSMLRENIADLFALGRCGAVVGIRPACSGTQQVQTRSAGLPLMVADCFWLALA